MHSAEGPPPISYPSGMEVHTPRSIARALRLGTMTDTKAATELGSWGSTKAEIEEALRIGHLYRGTSPT
jgi:hypothetical protein